MTVGEAKAIFRQIAVEYFGGATVVWGSLQSAVKPGLPFLVLQTGNVIRTRDTIRPASELGRYVPEKLLVDINLYTPGKQVTTAYGSYRENTAVADLDDFVNYLISPYAQQKLRENNIAITLEGGIMDLSTVIDDEYEYRARQEIYLHFTGETAGYAGISRTNWAQTPSGGGTAILAADADEEIEQVVFDEGEG